MGELAAERVDGADSLRELVDAGERLGVGAGGHLHDRLPWFVGLGRELAEATLERDQSRLVGGAIEPRAELIDSRE